jgi:hypothetical protein
VRAAEARAREAEQDLQAAKTGLARRTAAQDRTQDDLAARERPPTSESSSPMNATGPLMTVTMSPTPVSGPRTCATGPPTNATATADQRDRDRAANQRHRAADQRDRAADPE